MSSRGRGGFVQNAQVAPIFEDDANFQDLVNALIGEFDVRRDENPIRNEAFMFYSDQDFDNPDFAGLLELTSWMVSFLIEEQRTRPNLAMEDACNLVSSYATAMVGLTDDLAYRAGANDDVIRDMEDTVVEMERRLVPVLKEYQDSVCRGGMSRRGGRDEQRYRSNSGGGGWMSRQQENRGGMSRRDSGNGGSTMRTMIGSTALKSNLQRTDNRQSNNRGGSMGNHLLSRRNSQPDDGQDNMRLHGTRPRSDMGRPAVVTDSFGGDPAEDRQLNAHLEKRRSERQPEPVATSDDDFPPLMGGRQPAARPAAADQPVREPRPARTTMRTDSSSLELDPKEWFFFVEDLFDLEDVVAVADPEDMPLSDLRINTYNYLYCQETYTQMHAKLSDGNVVHIYKRNQGAVDVDNESTYLDHELDSKARSRALSEHRREHAASVLIVDAEDGISDENPTEIDVLAGDAHAYNDVIKATGLSDAESRYQLASIAHQFDLNRGAYFFTQSFTLIYDVNDSRVLEGLLNAETLGDMAMFMEDLKARLKPLAFNTLDRRFTRCINEQLQDALQLDWDIDSFTADIDQVVQELLKDFGDAVADNFNNQAYRLIHTALGIPDDMGIEIRPSDPEEEPTEEQLNARAKYFVQRYMVAHVPYSAEELGLDVITEDNKNILVGNIKSQYRLANVCSDALLRANTATDLSEHTTSRAVFLVTSDMQYYRVTAGQVMRGTCIISDASAMIAETF